MDITFAKCEQILDTLPIGYYAGRRVGISLQDEVPTSYYSPMTVLHLNIIITNIEIFL